MLILIEYTYQIRYVYTIHFHRKDTSMEYIISIISVRNKLYIAMKNENYAFIIFINKLFRCLYNII